MEILLCTLFLAYGVALYSRILAHPLPLSEYGLRYRPSWLPAILASMALVLVAGLRNNIGDTFSYMHAYRYGVFTWSSLDFSKDFGFNILQLLLKQISDDPQLLVFVTATVTTGLIVRILYRYSRMYELSLYLYITTGMFTTSMNGIRQFLAAAILFAGTRYLLNGDWKRFFLLVLFASTVHRSALVLLPLYFLVRAPAWTKQTFLLIGGAILIVLGFNQISGTVFSVIQDTQYGHYSSFSEGGASLVRVLVAAAPLAIAFYGRHKLKLLSPQLDPIINLSLLNVLVLLIATQNWIFARFTIYFGLYPLLLIPWLVKVFREKDQKLFYYVLILFYLLFFLYECIIAYGGLQYGSRYLVF
ncbi:EpsG family protein [Gorillibacterium sp. CAU 1737]|uniref:EpsG family protein n=1 Tax=Gorillibacterium sp. CAU 1737 TaxID=3140362 RepID=UPI00326115BB